METHYVYILYSPGIRRYYIGQTKDPEMRLEQHNQGFYEGSFKAKLKSKLVLSLENHKKQISLS